MNLRLQGFYRGRDLEEIRTVVRVHYRPDLSVHQTQPPKYGNLAVQADPRLFERYAVGSSHIVFILDCSGSMRPDPSVPGSRGLYPVAVVVFGGLFGATVLDTFLTPILFRTFASRALARLSAASSAPSSY